MTSVSIIIPCFNQSLYLFDAIESVFIQHLDDFEIIVVDDGSTDVTPAFHEELGDSSYLSLYKQDNQGAAAARNLGVTKATKEYLAFLDADDIWLANKIRGQLDALQQNKADMIFTHIEQFISPDIMSEKLANLTIKNKIMAGVCPSNWFV
jgi:glycosyltransferase involved in cell wall biosynthesis